MQLFFLSRMCMQLYDANACNVSVHVIWEITYLALVQLTCDLTHLFFFPLSSNRMHDRERSRFFLPVWKGMHTYSFVLLFLAIFFLKTQTNIGNTWWLTISSK
jgi:uncharacterized membrane protein